MHDTLQQLESPRIIHLRRYQPLLDNPQYGRILPRRDHLPRITRQERAEELDEPRDAAFLLPTHWREQEWQELAVCNGHV